MGYTYEKATMEIDGKLVRLKIEADDMVNSPREEMDGWLGEMVCFHSRYNLGDKVDYDSPSAFLRHLVSEYAELSDDAIVLKKVEEEFGKYIPKQDEDGDWILVDKDDDEDVLTLGWNRTCVFDTEEDALEGLQQMKDEYIDNILEELEDEELLEIIESKPNIVILPLYLYDHSGITMNTSGFSCGWDSGQVGWIWSTIEEAKKETGYQFETDEEWRNKIEEMLNNEVEFYDQYLTGDVWGFVLEEVDEDGDEIEQIDSCWGFYGTDYDKNGMKEHIEEKYHVLFDELS